MHIPDIFCTGTVTGTSTQKPNSERNRVFLYKICGTVRELYSLYSKLICLEIVQNILCILTLFKSYLIILEELER